MPAGPVQRRVRLHWAREATRTTSREYNDRHGVDPPTYQGRRNGGWEHRRWGGAQSVGDSPRLGVDLQRWVQARAYRSCNHTPDRSGIRVSLPERTPLWDPRSQRLHLRNRRPRVRHSGGMHCSYMRWLTLACLGSASVRNRRDMSLRAWGNLVCSWTVCQTTCERFRESRWSVRPNKRKLTGRLGLGEAPPDDGPVERRVRLHALAPQLPRGQAP